MNQKVGFLRGVGLLLVCEFGFEGVDLVAEGGPDADGVVEFLAGLLVGVGGLSEFIGVADDLRFFEVGRDGGLGGFEVGDLFFNAFEFSLERLEDFIALFAFGGFEFAAFLGVETRALGLGFGLDLR